MSIDVAIRKRVTLIFLRFSANCVRSLLGVQHERNQLLDAMVSDFGSQNPNDAFFYFNLGSMFFSHPFPNYYLISVFSGILKKCLKPVIQNSFKDFALCHTVKLVSGV